MNNKIKEMLDTNLEQHEYYEEAGATHESPLNSRATNLWRHIHRNVFSLFRNAEIQNSVSQIHQQWVGDISSAKVLDLGLGEGNPLSLKFAGQAREYVAIDLSSTRMKIFRTKLSAAGIKGARTYVADFLSDDFPEADFDVVYAKAVFHHFKHLEAFLESLAQRMSNGGIVITQDPIQTWIPIRLIRLAYRPLQTDAAWEFPFIRNNLDAIQRKFKIERVQGIYGYSKWAIPISILNPKLATHYAHRWHMKDLKRATQLHRITSCLQVLFMLRKE